METFAFNLWTQLPAGENVLVSPASILSALARATAGARGDTLTELLAALGYPNLGLLLMNVKEIEQAMASSNVNAANALFVNQGFDLNPLYTQNFANGEIKPLDFYGNPDESRQQINEWIAQETANRIQNMLGPGSINEQTKLAIANAVYLKLQWQNQFDVANTKQMSFSLLSGGSKQVQMMHQTVSGRGGKYVKTETYKALQLPYANSRMFRLYVLPNEGVSLELVEREIAQMGLDQLFQSMRPTEVEVYVPKFELRWGTNNLTDALRNMGVDQAFDQRADFTGIPADGNNSLYVSGVYHQAWGKDKEEGSEMAAATVVVARSKGNVLKPTFLANRPFMFFNAIPMQTGLAPIFMGRLVDPS